MFKAEIITDSINANNNRLTTFVITYPRFVHSELMTHRVFSRNSASSRAIPIEKMIEQVQFNPAMPVEWGINQSGMQAKILLGANEQMIAIADWLDARDSAVEAVQSLSRLGVHKQLANRLLEPWAWITVIISATEWSNFFKLRCHPDAQPEIRHIANMMQEEYNNSQPKELDNGKWHLPFINSDERMNNSIEGCLAIATGRIARVSYLTHNGVRDTAKDIELHDRLVTSGHWSPFEHCAHVDLYTAKESNFKGWIQYRKQFKGEDGNV